MIRRAFDERCVLFDGRDDNILQLVLPLNEFRSFVDDRHILPPCELSASWTRAKHVVKGTRIPFPGLERPHDSLGSRRLPKAGSLQPNSVFCPRPKLIAAPCASSTLPLTSVHHWGERNGERGGDLCLSCTVHRHCGLQKLETNGLSPERYRRTQFYRESVGRIPSAHPALLVLRCAMLRTGFQTAARETVAAQRSGIQNPQLPGPHIPGFPTSCEPGSNGGLHSKRPIQAAFLPRRGSGLQPFGNARPLVRCIG